MSRPMVPHGVISPVHRWTGAHLQWTHRARPRGNYLESTTEFDCRLQDMNVFRSLKIEATSERNYNRNSYETDNSDRWRDTAWHELHRMSSVADEDPHYDRCRTCYVQHSPQQTRKSYHDLLQSLAPSYIIHAILVGSVIGTTITRKTRKPVAYSRFLNLASSNSRILLMLS